MFSNNSTSFLKLKGFNNVGDTFRGLNLFPLIAKELNLSSSPSERKTEDDEKEEEKSISNTVFVGNIDFRVSRAALRKFFNKFGRVNDVYIVKNHFTRTSKGIAFVKFAKKESAEAAIEASIEEATLDNRVLRIFPAEEKRMKRLRKESNELKEERKEEIEEDKSKMASPDDIAGPSTVKRKFAGNILDVDDDVMMMIFGYLSVEDLYEAEYVCRHWSSLAIRCWSSKRHLDFRNCFSSFGKRPLGGNMLKTFLKRCGRNLKSLDVSTISYSMDYRSIEFIAHLCPNLEMLDLSGVQLTNIALRTLAESCTKLKSVTFQKCSNMGEKGLWWLLNKCRDMEYVNVTQNLRITGQCFHRAGPCVRTLVLNGCFNFSSAGFEKISERCTNLTELHINGCIAITSSNFEKICSNCPNIVKLDIGSGVLNSIAVNSLRHLQHLTKLEDLNLSQNNSVLNDDALRLISQFCPNLKILDVSACGFFVTDAGLKHLKCCTKLTTLDVSYLNISDDSMKVLASLGSFEEVRCKGCGITDLSCETFINLCSGLRTLDVSGCDMVTLCALDTALEVVQVRPESGPKLQFVVGGTGIVLYSLDYLDDYVHPLLDICTLNLCRGDLMPYDRLFLDEYDDNFDDDYDDDYDDSDEDGLDYDDFDYYDPIVEYEQGFLA